MRISNCSRDFYPHERIFELCTFVHIGWQGDWTGNASAGITRRIYNFGHGLVEKYDNRKPFKFDSEYDHCLQSSGYA